MSGRDQTDLRELFDGLREPLAIHREGRFVYVNLALARLLGYERDELVGRRGAELIHPDDRKRIGALVEADPPAGPTPSTPAHRLLRKDGRHVYVDVYSVPIHFDGAVMSLSFARDLTERRRLDAQLVTADRLASIGRLAAAVGHEVNNPLAFMLATIEQLAGAVDAGELDRERLRDGLATLREGAGRIRHIVQDLKTFVQADREARGAVDVHRVLGRCLEMAAHELRHRGRVTRELAASRLAWANEPRLEQVFLNLLINAAQAIPGGPHDQHEIAIKTRDDAADRIVVEISDTGVGISPEDLERVFDPFFTTKPVGVGTGLGLSICHSIVTSLGGTIALAPRPGGGTTVRVSLPAARSTATATPTAPRAPAAPRAADARVLVVDDEPYLVSALALSLGHHRISTASSGRDAIALLGREPFDLIVSDLHMAGVSGVDLYEHVRATYPGLEHRMIFMTGGIFTDRAREFVTSVAPPLLEKPFDLDALAREVDRLLTA